MNAPADGVAFKPAATLSGPGFDRDGRLLQSPMSDHARFPALPGQPEAQVSILGHVVCIPSTAGGKGVARKHRPYVADAPNLSATGGPSDA